MYTSLEFWMFCQPQTYGSINMQIALHVGIYGNIECIQYIEKKESS